ncbi:MAG TPA: kelch repeat-containing protein [Thermoplasmata archaeon]|nr:kelch repeat-containing protein [Thermoplasmata archaeon]
MEPRGPLSRRTPACFDRLLPTLLLGALALMFVLPSPAFGPSPSNHSGVPAVATFARPDPVAAAQQSIVAGTGPVAGLSGCAPITGGISCTASKLAPHPLGSGVVAPAAWTDLTGSAGGPPPARYIASMVWDPVDNYVVLYGGYGSSGVMSDTWSFSNGQWNQLSPTNTPPGVYASPLAWDATDNYAVLFGGYSGSLAYYNQTWTFVHGAWTNITGTTNQTPGARWRQSMTWDAADGYVLMFGGTNSVGTALSDTWSFVKGKWTLLTVSGSPPGRYRASMAYDAADGYAVLFGGCTTSTCPDSGTWTYHNLTWTSLSLTTHPSARVYFGITYSPTYQHVILFGGSSSGTGNVPLSDTWAFANDTWQSLTPNLTRSPSARPYVAMAFDYSDNYSIIFGGQWSNGTFIDQTWALGPSILGKLTIAPGAIDLGQTAQLNATPFAYSNYVGYNYTSLPPGCTNQNVSVLACTPNAVGTFPIVVSLNDSSHTTTNETGTLVVNRDTAITSYTVDHATVTRGVMVQFEVAATGGTGSYTYHYTGLPPGCVTSSVDNLTCTPSSTASGAYPVNVKVTDQANYAVNLTLTLNVNPTPTFARVTARPSVLDVGQTFTVWANLTTNTGTAPFTYLYTGLPSGCASVNSSVLTCAPSAAGALFVLVSAHDLFGFAASGNASITVNAAPQISSSALRPTPIDAGTPIAIWVNGTGGTGALTYTFAGAPPGCRLLNRSLNTCTPTSSGNFTITATATDQAGFSATTTFTLVVNEDYASTGVVATPDNLDAGQNLSLTLSVSGGTAPFSYAWSGVPAGCPSTTTASTLSCSPQSSGTFAITVTGTDLWRNTVTGGVQVIVNPVPAIAGFTASASPATVGQEVDLTVQTTGGSGDFAFVYAHLPDGCASANTSVLHCTPTAAGSFNISVTATDSRGLSTTSYLALSVNAASSGSSLFGSGSVILYVVIAVVVLVVVAALVLVMRRRRAPPARAPAAESAPEESSG